MRIIVATLAGTLIACGLPTGEGRGAWGTPEGGREVTGPAVASWCAGRGRVLLELSHEQGTIGVLWRYGTLVAESLAVVSPQPTDSVVIPIPSASVVLRYVEAAEVRGYSAFSGTVQITEVDTTTLSANVQVRMMRLE
ncbi:MAG: hypothetical protein M3N43_08005, partial [Actinomycetota bacterium]|nr:hypothetical protein [Actinomycetota bacterium]